MQRAPFQDTYPFDPAAESLIQRLALGGRRPQPLELPPRLRAEAARRYAEIQGPEPAGERDRGPQMLAGLLLICSAALVVGCALAALWLASR